MGFCLFVGTVVVIVSSEPFVKTQLRGDCEWREIRISSVGLVVLVPMFFE